MESVKHYLFSVVCAAVACAIVSSMIGKKGSTGALVKLVMGIFLAFTLVAPISTLELKELYRFTEDIRWDASGAAAMGQSLAEESMAAIIKSEAEAYILDKADTLNIRLTAEVILNSDQIPESVTLCGAVPPYAKFRLADILEEDLGIPEENQRWID